MPSQNSTQAANVTTAADEISRFARYVEFRTRDLRASVANYIARTDTTIPARTFREREEMYEEDIFVDIEAPDEEGWVGVTDEVKELHADFSQQIYYRPPTPPPGPIQQTGEATQRAALQALGLTGTYLELGLRLVAEDVGWLTHTATFEDAMQKVQRRFPMLTKLSESYGKGAKQENARRRSDANAKPRLALGGAGGWSAAGVSSPSSSRKLTEEEIGRFAELEEVPLQDEGEGWSSLRRDTV